MSSDLFFENKKYISAKDAAQLTSYTSDYVGQLCRANKVESKKIGRTWYVSEESILNHKNLGMELFAEEKISPINYVDTKKQKINLSGRAPFLSRIKLPDLSGHIQKAHKKIFSYNPNFSDFSKKIVTAGLILVFAIGILSTKNKIIGLTLSTSRLADMVPSAISKTFAVLEKNYRKVSNDISNAPMVSYGAMSDVVHLYSNELSDGLTNLGMSFIKTSSDVISEAGRFVKNPPLYIVSGFGNLAKSESGVVDSGLAFSGKSFASAYVKTFSFISDSVGALPFVATQTAQKISDVKNLTAGAVLSLQTQTLTPVDRAGVAIYDAFNSFFDRNIYSPLAVLFGSKPTITAPTTLPAIAKIPSKPIVVKNNSGASANSGTSVNTNQVSQIVAEVMQKIQSNNFANSSANNSSGQIATNIVTSADLDLRLQEMNNKIMSEFSQLGTGSGGNVTNIYQEIAGSQRIDQLSGTNISNPTITNANISGGNISGVSIAATSISADSLSVGTLSVGPANFSGAVGIGTTTAPADLNVTGNANVSGTLTVGSLVSGGQTIGGNFGVTGSTTLADLLVTGNSIFQNSTTTNSFIANLFANNISAGSITATSSATLGTTTMTNLSVTNTATSTFAGGISVAGNINFNGILMQNNSPFIRTQWSTNGGNIYYNTGNVGIGTSTPYASLSVEGSSALGNSALAGYFIGTSTTATSTFSGGVSIDKGLQLNNGYIFGAGLANCSLSTGKLVWNSATGQFACGVDAGSSGVGITSFGAQYSVAQTNANQTLATSTSLDANIRLSITSASDTHTFTPYWVGTLDDSKITSSANWNTAYSSRITSASLPLSFIGNVLSIAQANSSTNGFISAGDFSKFNSATTTFNGGLTYSNASNQVTVNPSQSITTLSNLTSNGFVYTADGTGLLNITASSSIFGFTPASNARIIGTTYPLLGGGNLTGDLTLSLGFGTTTSNTWSGLQTFSNIGTTTFAGGIDTTKGLNLNNGYIFGAGLGACDPSSGKITWNSATGQFGCGSDAGSGGGLTSLNGLIAAVQTFATTSNNGGWGITSLGTVHTLNIPTASATNPLGLLSSADYTTFTNKQNALGFTPANSTITLTAGGGLSGGGDLTASRTFAIDFTRANTWTGLQQFNANASTTQLTTTGSTYLATTGGNVGIGTTVPGSKLDVNGYTIVRGTGSGSALDVFGNGGRAIGWGDTSVLGGFSYVAGAVTLTAVAANTDFRINTDNNSTVGITVKATTGNVGIGTTNPQYTLEVNGTASSTSLVLGNALASAYGGTGFSTYTKGDLIIANNANSLSKLGIGTVGTTGILGISAGLPAWVATSSLNIDVSNTVGTLPVNRGGTGATTFTSGNILYGAGTGAIQSVATSSIANGTGITVTNGSSAYVIGSQPTINCNTANGSTFGCLSSADYTTFNNKWDLSSSTIPLNKGGTGLTSVGASSTVLTTNGSVMQWNKLATSQLTNDSSFITSAGAPVQSVSNSDGTLTISPTTGAVVSSLNLAHGNTFTALQQFNANASTTQLTTTGSTYLATTGGNVGIGTTNPNYKLEVNGTASTTSLVLGNALLTTYGGTGLSSVASNALLYGSGSTTLNTLSSSNSSILTTSASGVPTWVATSTLKINLSDVTGILQASQFPALSGDITTTAGSLVTTLATVNGSVGTFNNLTVNGKGLVTAASTVAYLTTAITSLGGQTGASQTFATTSNNGGWGITSATNVHTLNIPTASATNLLGLLSNTDWTTFNNKWDLSSSTIPLNKGGTGLTSVGASSTVLTTNGAVAQWNKLATSQLTNDLGWTNNTGTVTSVGLSDSNSTLTIGSSPVTTSGTITATLNLGHSNTWTALQSFNYSSSTAYSSFVTASTTNLILNGQSFSNLLGSGLSNSSGALTIGTGAITNTMLANSSVTVSPGAGLSGGGTVALGGTITLTNSGVTSILAGTNVTVSGATGAVTINSTGSVSTSSGETAGQLSYWTTTNGTPAKLGSVATTTLTASGALSLSQPISVIGSSPSALTCLTANGSTFGCLSGADWTTFNNKWDLSSSTIPLNKGGTGLTSVGASSTVLTTNGAVMQWNKLSTSQLTNDSNFITLSSLTGDSPITYNTSTGHIGFTNPGYITTAITSLNGLTGSVQTFATTSNNTGWGIISGGTTHTLNIPTASATNPLGLLSSADWTTFNGKQNNLGFTPLASYDAWTHPSTGQSATTSLMVLNGNASTTQLTTTGSTYLATTGGNVGIGTTGPGGVLHVKNTAKTNTLVLESVYGSIYPQLNFIGTDGNTVYGGYVKSYFSGGEILTLGTRNNSVVTDTVTLKDGNVGIGTTSPYRTLSVAGSGIFTGGDLTASTLTATSSISTPALTISGFSAGTFCLKSVNGLLQTATADCGSGSGNNSWVINGVGGTIYNATTTDLVGIGTNAPTATLYVKGRDAETSPFVVASSTDTAMFSILPTGKIGIGLGATNPLGRLHVKAAATDASALVVDTGASTDPTAQSSIRFSNSNYGFAYVALNGDNTLGWYANMNPVQDGSNSFDNQFTLGTSVNRWQSISIGTGNSAFAGPVAMTNGLTANAINITGLSASSLVMSDASKNLQSVTLGTGLSFTGSTLNCLTANGSTFGCLSSTDWTTFNNKWDLSSSTIPLNKGGTGLTSVGASSTVLTTNGAVMQWNKLSTSQLTNDSNFITLSSLTGDSPITYNTSTGHIGFNGLSTSTAAVVGNIPYFTGVNTFGNVATSTATCSSGVNCVSFSVIGSVAPIITNTGLLSLTQNGGGTAQTGAITFATSTLSLNGQTQGIAITNSTGTFTFTPTLSGTLNVTGGGTGLSTVASNSLLYGSGSTALNTLSTVNSSILTTGATGVPTWVATSTLKINLSDVTGTLQAAQFPALSGDLTTTAGSLATTLATVNGSVGTFNNLTVNGKGLVTSASNVAYLTTAITSLNGQTGATQTFATTSNNGGFGFSSATNVHTLNIPTASASSLGLLSSSDFTTFNSKQATISTTWPITLSGATLGFNGLSTSSQAVVGNIPYFTGVNTFGNVGTTTLSASGLLSLSGTTNILGSSPITLSLSLTKGYFAVGSDSNVAQATSTIFISSTGNVGIGTTTPQWPLQVSNATLPQFAIGDSSLTSNKWTFRNAGGYLYIATSSPSTFATSSVSALSIDLNGNLTLSSALSLTSGGTGFSTYTKGDLIIANNTNSLSKLGIGTIGTSGILGISSGLPAWVATSSLNIDVSNTIGTLAVNRGGTGQTTFTGNQLMYGNFSQVATTSLGVTGPITFSGTMGAQVGGGTGNFGCTTAASGVAGCLSSTMFDTFNGKQATIAVTYPITLSGATIGSAFGTTTTIGVGNDLFLYTSHTGVISGVASSSLSLPNTSLQNSNISGVALGGSLFAHTHDTSLTGTSYNGSAAVSDWGLALNHTNTWSVLQNFNYSSTTGYATFQTSSSTLGYIGTLNLTNALSVANGGTGAVTLTGCLTGNGTGAFTASGTCNTSNATVSSVGLSSSGSITVGSTPVTTSGTITANLNMANANTWTALQSFTNASSTLFSANTAWFNNFNATSTTATSTISTGGLTVGTNQFVIQQNSGNIGMGIATPSAKLQILGSDILNTTQTLNVSGSSGTGLVVTNAGNVGIGTTSPSQKLTVQGKSYFSDMVGIGTNSPNAALDVEGLCVTGDTLLPIRRRRKGKKSNLTDGNIGKETSDHDTSDVEWDYLNIAIKDIVEGDEVLSLNENKGIVEYHRIKALMDMGVKQVFELRTKSGRVIRTTANHPYLARLAPGSKPKFFTRFASKITSVLAENPTLASQKQTTQTVGNVKSTTQNHITNSPATPEISESREILTSVSRDTAIPKFINN